ncbi:MAG TPA: AAA family ATPase [Paludibacter sp.]|nr:AAA family ATPase [Paludibacter sp.]
MEQLIQNFRKKIAYTETDFIRSLMEQINWDARLIGIKGSRGVGKTTLLLQYIKLNLEPDLDRTLYASLDNIWFSEHKLIDLVDEFSKRGGKYLFLDEVHKYAGWSVEIKNIYDDYPELKVVFTGSSLLEILDARADLSRRAIIYQMFGLSFREYLNIELKENFKAYCLAEIIEQHGVISQQLVSKFKPLRYFESYLKSGYYPFYRELPDLYYTRIEEVINMILEIELPLLRNVQTGFIPKLKQLLYIISSSAPFIPNISKLSERIGVNRETLLGYLHALNDAHLIFTTYKDTKGISLLQKPDKIFLENPNLMFAIDEKNVDQANARETFFANQLRVTNFVELSAVSDFLIDGQFTFEIGGGSKKKKQIENLENAYIAADNIEFGYEKKIPLWLFGFLY